MPQMTRPLSRLSVASSWMLPHGMCLVGLAQFNFYGESVAFRELHAGNASEDGERRTFDKDELTNLPACHALTEAE